MYKLNDLIPPENWYQHIGQLHPVLSAKLETVLIPSNDVIEHLRLKFDGRPLRIIDSFRTVEEQKERYRAGTGVAPYSSYHQAGTAVDIIPRTGYKPIRVNNQTYFDKKDDWIRAGIYQAFEDAGLVWGGRFKNFDGVHIQHPKYKPSFKMRYWLEARGRALYWAKMWRVHYQHYLDKVDKIEDIKRKFYPFIHSLVKAGSDLALKVRKILIFGALVWALYLITPLLKKRFSK